MLSTAPWSMWCRRSTLPASVRDGHRGAGERLRHQGLDSGPLLDLARGPPSVAASTGNRVLSCQSRQSPESSLRSGGVLARLIALPGSGTLRSAGETWEAFFNVSLKTSSRYLEAASCFRRLPKLQRGKPRRVMVADGGSGPPLPIFSAYATTVRPHAPCPPATPSGVPSGTCARG